MAISDQLLAVNTAKTNIKAAIEEKGVDLTGIPFTDYHTSITSISSMPDGLPDTWSQEYYDAVKTTVDALDLSWTRPAEWLTIGTVLDTESKFIGLTAVYEAYPHCALSCTTTDSSQYTVDWGDGTIENFDSGITASHTYTYATLGGLTSYGYKQAIVTVTGNLQVLDVTKLTTIETTDKDSNYWLDIELSINAGAADFIVSERDFSSGVSSAYMLERVALRRLGYSADVFLNNTFQNCYKLQEVILPTVQTISGAAYTFHRCYSLRTINIDFGTFSTYDGTFRDCYSLVRVITGQSRSGSDRRYIFQNCYSLLYAPDIFNGTESSITTGCFAGCKSLIAIPQYTQKLNGDSLFNGCISLPNVPVLNISGSTQNMFKDCSNIKNITVNYDGTSAIITAYMFQNCTLLSSVNVSTLISSNCSYMFSGCTSLIHTSSISLCDTTSCTNFSYMFHNCYNLLSVDLFDTSAGTLFNNMFQLCYTLSTVPLFNTASGTNLSSMFANCSSLSTVPLFVTTVATNVSKIFADCYSLLEIPALDLSLNTGSLFITNCNSLTKCSATSISKSINLDHARLTDTEINNIYNNLITTTGQFVKVRSNPGTATADHTIATNKGWTVYT